MNLEDDQMLDDGDAEIAEVRAVRHRISESFGHDVYRLVAHLIELQKRHVERLLPAPESERLPSTPGR